MSGNLTITKGLSALVEFINVRELTCFCEVDPVSILFCSKLELRNSYRGIAVQTVEAVMRSTKKHEREEGDCLNDETENDKKGEIVFYS